MPVRFSVLLVFLFCCLCLGAPAGAAAYKRDGDIVGEITSYTVKKGDNLSKIARRFDIGIVELRAANPEVSPERLKAGAQLTITTSHVLPAIRRGIVLNLSELRLFYFPDDTTVITFPVGIGREGWQTQPGNTRIVRKRKDPTWTPPESIREENPDLPDFIPPGPDNPLGHYALDLGMGGYAIHGTNQPYSVGKRCSHGCMRLYPEDIEMLFDVVSVGTPVAIIDTPWKLGWRGNTLFLEVMPTQQEDDAVAVGEALPPVEKPEIREAVREAAGADTEIDWDAVERTVTQRTGVPAAVGQRTGN